MENGKSSWKLIYNRFKPVQESLRETLCTLGNGYFGTRGSVEESLASRVHYPGTYIAGVYNKVATRIGVRKVFNEDFVNCPNWLFLTFRMGRGEWIIPSVSNILSYYQELDMKKGVLIRKIRVQDSRGQRATIKTQRIVHMGDPHRAAIKYTIIPENYEGWIIVRSALDGTVENTGVARYRRLNSRHLEPSAIGTFGSNGIYLSMKTAQSAIEISEASKVHIFTSLNRKGIEKEIKPVGKVLRKEKKLICQDFEIFVHKQQVYEIEKIVSIYTSRDKDITKPLDSAINSAKNSHRFNSLLKSHTQAWDTLWKKFDIQIEGDTFSQKVLRLHIFHLLQTASIHNTNIDAGFPARGLHGEAYRGHIFWDEIFGMPFFDLHEPEVSKSLLLYRYRRLSQARKYAMMNGYNGAMFPWQSASTGKEETQVIHLNPLSGKWGKDYSRSQRHISFAIAYNVWQYYRRTNDLDFLRSYGAEMLLSIARFGASLSKYDAKDKKYHTEGLMGPDEFHEKFTGNENSGLKDNAYTNLMIVWALLKAMEVLDILPDYNKNRISKKLRLTCEELTRWKDITHKMNIIFNTDNVISQFDGYFKLKELDLELYRKKYDNIKRMDRILKAEGKSPNDYKLIKQADVLMIFYLLSLDTINDLLKKLGYRFDKNILNKNYDYYIKRTSHGSTLSTVVHCYIASLLGKSKEAWQGFLDILKSDIYDTQVGTTPEGIHTGVMAGSIDIVMRCFAGVNILNDCVKIIPNLPKKWHKLKLKFCYKENWFSLSITKNQILIIITSNKKKVLPTGTEIEKVHKTVLEEFKVPSKLSEKVCRLKPNTIPIEICGKLYYLGLGKKYNISLKKY